jgi:probable rRNA maturation factor
MRAKPVIGAAEVMRLAAGVIKAEKASVTSISITFVGTARIRTLNKHYLRHDHATDVIAFGLGPPLMASIIGDIYIAPAAAAANAKRFGTSAKDETRRLVVHGMLHVLGYDHPKVGDRTTSDMWRRQERLLKKLTGRAR